MPKDESMFNAVRLAVLIFSTNQRAAPYRLPNRRSRKHGPADHPKSSARASFHKPAEKQKSRPKAAFFYALAETKGFEDVFSTRSQWRKKLKCDSEVHRSVHHVDSIFSTIHIANS
jgi:hypothetical protein